MTNSSVVLHAELENGQVVTGESKIPTYGERIKRVFLTPDTIERFQNRFKSFVKLI
ncbi:2-phospho-L-lactate transferase CofD family protein [Bacillus sp. SL00103]